MPVIEIRMTDDQLSVVEQKAKASHFDSVSDYVMSLIDGEKDGGKDYGAPEHLRVKSVEHLAELIQEGLDSGPGIPLTDEYIEQLRNRVTSKIDQVAREKATA